MSAVPASLRPWVRALDPFDDRVARALSTWLPRLSLLLGPLAHSAEAGGDPDGYDGVDCRGPYERLLLSEWAVAMELPDEFMRRAAMHEHLFIELSRRQPQGALQSLVLVDGGPDQLGAPRLVHVAAALVGAARARRAKAAYAWGVITGAPRLFPQVDVESVRHMLDTRHADPLPAGALDRWHRAVSRFEGSVDVLFVGGPHLARRVEESAFHGAARVLQVEPSTKCGRDGRHVAVHIGGVRPRRDLALPLPDDPTVVRALRDPFEREQHKDGPVPVLDVIPEAGLAIPAGGRRILVRTRTGIAGIVEPNSARAPLGAPREMRLEPDDVLCAVGLAGKRLIAVVARAGGTMWIAVQDGGRVRLKVQLPTRVSASAQLADAARPLTFHPGVSDDETLAPVPGLDQRCRGFHDHATGESWLLMPATRTARLVDDEPLFSSMRHRGSELSLGRERGDLIVAVRTEDGRDKARLAAVETARVGRAFLGAYRAEGGIPGALVVEHGSRAVLLWTGAGHGELPLPPGELVGALHHPAFGACAMLVEDDRRLVFAGREGLERHSFPLRIVAAVPNIEQSQVAVMTADGTVTVLFTRTGVRRVVCRGTGAGR